MTTSTLTDRDINDELNKISTLNGWGFLGIIFPLVGFICGGLARGRAIKLQALLHSNQKGKFEKLIRSKRTTSGIVILLSIVTTGVILIGISTSGPLSSSNFDSTGKLNTCIESTKLTFESEKTKYTNQTDLDSLRNWYDNAIQDCHRAN